MAFIWMDWRAPATPHPFGLTGARPRLVYARSKRPSRRSALSQYGEVRRGERPRSAPSAYPQQRPSRMTLAAYSLKWSASSSAAQNTPPAAQAASAASLTFTLRVCTACRRIMAGVATTSQSSDDSIVAG